MTRLFFDSRRVGPPLIADWDFQHARPGKSKLIRKPPAICLQGLLLKAAVISPLLPIARPMWLPGVHLSVLLPLSPRPTSPPAKQDPAVDALKPSICVLVRPSASPRNPSSALHPPPVPVCLSTLQASTTPWSSSRRKNKPRKTGARACPIPTRKWNQFTQTRKTYLHLSRPRRCQSKQKASQSSATLHAFVFLPPPARHHHPMRSHSGYARRPSRVRAIFCTRRISSFRTTTPALQSGLRRTTRNSARPSTTRIHRPISCRGSSKVP